MKKIIALVLAVLLLSAVLTPAAADGEARFVVSDASACAGEEISLTVSLADNPGIASFEYSVVYDSDILEWTGVTQGTLPGTWDVAVGEAVTWIDADNHTDNGIVTTLTFKVKADVPPQTTVVSIEYDPNNVFNENAENVSFAVVPGTVSITAEPDFVLPALLTTIGEEAFAGGAFSYVKLSENTVAIGPRAFADCRELAFVYIPAAATSIDPAAFEGVTGLTILGTIGSYAQTYADAHGFTFAEA